MAASVGKRNYRMPSDEFVAIAHTEFDIARSSTSSLSSPYNQSQPTSPFACPSVQRMPYPGSARSLSWKEKIAYWHWNQRKGRESPVSRPSPPQLQRRSTWKVFLETVLPKDDPVDANAANWTEILHLTTWREGILENKQT